MHLPTDSSSKSVSHWDELSQGFRIQLLLVGQRRFSRYTSSPYLKYSFSAFDTSPENTATAQSFPLWKTALPAVPWRSTGSHPCLAQQAACPWQDMAHSTRSSSESWIWSLRRSLSPSTVSRNEPIQLAGCKH